MDWIMIFIGFGLVLTGAAFFGFPVGWAMATRSAHREIEHLPAGLPSRLKDALARKQPVKLSREDTILLADYLEEKS